MELILWRHAEAADGVPDIDRPLTARGIRQARKMARWLSRRLPERWTLLTSPALRAKQTAVELSEEFVVMDDIAPGATCGAVLGAAGWPDVDDTVIVVGHQPTLGETAAMLMSGRPAPWSMRKGSICWLSQRQRNGDAQVVLRAIVSPDLV